MINQDEIIEYLDRKIIGSRSLIDGETVENEKQRVSAFHYKRAVSLLRGIRSLAVYGSSVEISVLLRSLFNLRVNLGWILFEDTERRLNRYLDFIPIYRKEYFDHFIENREEPFEEISEEEYQEVSNEYEEIIEKYDLTSYRDLNNWSGTSIYQMAEQINAEDEYTALYSKASDIEHSNPNISHLYLFIDDENKINSSIRDYELIISLIHLGIHYFLVVKHLVSTVFNTIESEEIAAELEDFKKYQAIVYKQLQNIE